MLPYTLPPPPPAPPYSPPPPFSPPLRRWVSPHLMCSAAQHFVRYRPAAGDHASHAVQAFRAVPWLFGGRAKFSLKSSFFSDSVCSFYPHESCIVANVIIISVSSLFLFYRHFCFIIIFVFSLFRLLQGCFAGGRERAAVGANARQATKK